MPTYSIPAGVPTIIAQNVEYALPARAHLIVASVDVQVSQTLGGTYTPLTVADIKTGAPCAANFVKCTTGAATVTAKV